VHDIIDIFPCVISTLFLIENAYVFYWSPGETLEQGLKHAVIAHSLLLYVFIP